MALWYLNQVGETSKNKEVDKESNDHVVRDTTDTRTLLYPPIEEPKCVEMITYWHSHKQIPFPLDKQFSTVDVSEIPTTFIPKETSCHFCKGSLSEPVLISNKARIITMTKVIESVNTFFKYCSNCSMFYRYQEYEDGVHNFYDLCC